MLSSPPSAIASQLQSFLAERAVAENKPVARQLPGGAEEAKFDSNDWLGWAKSFFSWAGGLKPAKWQTAPLEPQSMPDDAHVALLADWGTGLYGAPACAKCISSSGKPFTHVIHLGDVYYSGTESEIDERFIALWPTVAGRTISLAMATTKCIRAGMDISGGCFRCLRKRQAILLARTNTGCW